MSGKVNRQAARSLAKLIGAYWTPERIKLWNEYKESGSKLPWREYEHAHREESVPCPH